MDTDTSTIRRQIAQILATPEPGLTFTPTRYPAKYAREFFRQHADALVPGVKVDSINDSDAIRAYAERTQQPLSEVYIALADGFMSEWRIDAEPFLLADLAAAARAEFPLSYLNQYDTLTDAEVGFFVSREERMRSACAEVGRTWEGDAAMTGDQAKAAPRAS